MTRGRKRINRNHKIAPFILATRTGMEMTKTEFGELLGKNRYNVKQWEDGKSAPTMDTIKLWAVDPNPAISAFGLTLAEMRQVENTTSPVDNAAPAPSPASDIIAA
jgi:transcriptional regulator with XRE-family HTH domain